MRLARHILIQHDRFGTFVRLLVSYSSDSTTMPLHRLDEVGKANSLNLMWLVVLA